MNGSAVFRTNCSISSDIAFFSSTKHITSPFLYVRSFSTLLLVHREKSVSQQNHQPEPFHFFRNPSPIAFETEVYISIGSIDIHLFGTFVQDKIHHPVHPS